MLPSRVRLLVVPPLVAFVAANVVFGLAALVQPSFFLIRVVYDTGTLFFPAIFLLCALALVAMRCARRHPRAVALLLVLAAAGFGARVWATHIEPRRLTVHEVEVPVAGLAAPVRLLHLSDIQSDAVGEWEERIMEAVRELDPDLVILTGDLLHPLPPATLRSELPKIRALLEGIDPPLGKFMVDGDTDTWVRTEPEVASLRRLSGREDAIEAGGARLRLLGLTLGESADPDAARAKVRRWLEGIGPGEIAIVAGHRPDYAMGLVDLPVDLALAGHTHGGQVRLPFYGPIITLSRVPREWARGFRRIGQPWLNVSAGLGNEHTAGLPALRLFCPPEMTLITLSPAGSARQES